MKQILCEILQVAVSYWYVYFSFKLLVFSQGNTFKLTFKKFQLICSHKIGNSCLTFWTKYMLYVMLDLVRICSSKESFDNFCIKCSLIKFKLQNKRMINVFLRRFFFFLCYQVSFEGTCFSPCNYWHCCKYVNPFQVSFCTPWK